MNTFLLERMVEVYQNMVLGASGQSFINLILTYFTNFKTWILSLFGGVGLVRIAWEGYKYKQGDDMERNEATKKIKSSLGWFIGLPFALWLAADIWAKAKGLI